MEGGIMKLVAFSLLVLNLVHHVASTTEPVTVTAKRSKNPTDFIKSSCKATRYPVVCVQTLKGYANAIRQSDRQLAITALSVSISRTRSCGSFIKKVAKVKGLKAREYGAVRDCIENMDDSVDRLSKSVTELGLAGKNGKDFLWHVSNVQTWVSSALTYQDTCLDGFDHVDGKLKAAIRQRVVDVSQVTSNALALVNRFSSSHRI